MGSWIIIILFRGVREVATRRFLLNCGNRIKIAFLQICSYKLCKTLSDNGVKNIQAQSSVASIFRSVALMLHVQGQWEVLMWILDLRLKIVNQKWHYVHFDALYYLYLWCAEREAGDVAFGIGLKIVNQKCDSTFWYVSCLFMCLETPWGENPMRWRSGEAIQRFMTGFLQRFKGNNYYPTSASGSMSDKKLRIGVFHDLWLRPHAKKPILHLFLVPVTWWYIAASPHFHLLHATNTFIQSTMQILLLKWEGQERTKPTLLTTFSDHGNFLASTEISPIYGFLSISLATSHIYIVRRIASFSLTATNTFIPSTMLYTDLDARARRLRKNKTKNTAASQSLLSRLWLCSLLPQIVGTFWLQLKSPRGVASP